MPTLEMMDGDDDSFFGEVNQSDSAKDELVQQLMLDNAALVRTVKRLRRRLVRQAAQIEQMTSDLAATNAEIESLENELLLGRADVSDLLETSADQKEIHDQQTRDLNQLIREHEEYISSITMSDAEVADFIMNDMVERDGEQVYRFPQTERVGGAVGPKRKYANLLALHKNTFKNGANRSPETIQVVLALMENPEALRFIEDMDSASQIGGRSSDRFKIGLFPE
jgi:hypothetical protein